MDVKELKAQIDTKNVSMVLKMMLAVTEELIPQLSLNVFGSSHFDHLFPAVKVGVNRYEHRKRLIADILSVFDTACVNQSLKRLKIRVLPNKIIGQ